MPSVSESGVARVETLEPVLTDTACQELTMPQASVPFGLRGALSFGRARDVAKGDCQVVSRV